MIRSGASLILIVSATVYAQPAAAPHFEVASVRPSRADQSNGSGGHSGRGRLTMNNVTLKRCIMGAFGIGPNQIMGGPAWLDSDLYEIVAKADQPVDDDVLMVMLQTLLAERFKLAIHRETKTIQALVLEVAKRGPQLEKGDGGESTTNSGRARIDARNTTMDHFAEVLSRQMQAPVINRTGLEGVFNLKLEWTPESAKPIKLGADGGGMESGVSIFTAIQEQIGLRLQSRKEPIEMLVIDHAERPSEN